MRKQKQLKRAFRSANAIVALEGWVPSRAARKIQARVIEGQLTFDQAVRACIQAARRAG